MNHILNIPGGHAVLGGRGGDGRATISKMAAILAGIEFFSVPSGSQYNKELWRKDFRRLIRNTGCFCKDSMLFVTARQLLKHPFLLEDILSFLARGEVFNLFDLDERHELNEYVHQHLLRKSTSGIISELSPDSMYEIFVSICKEKLHVVISYNAENESVAKVFRKHPVLVKNAVHIAVKVMRAHNSH